MTETNSDGKEAQSQCENKVSSASPSVIKAENSVDAEIQEESNVSVFSAFYAFCCKFSLRDFLKKHPKLLVLIEVSFILYCFCFFGTLLHRWFFERVSTAFGSDISSVSEEHSNTIGNVNVLVMGVDSVEGTHRSDTIFLLGVNPSRSSVSMISIPRDTRVIVEGKARKINEILPRYGSEVLKALLEGLFNVSINRSVEVGFQSFTNVIDVIGGIDVNIEKPMHYDDNAGNLHIHFEPGINHLNGKQSLEYVRFRADAMADLGRIKRQQGFVKEVLKKLSAPSSIVKLPQIISGVINEVKTDFTITEVVLLANAFKTYKIKFKSMSLPGEPRYIGRISYFVPYSDEAFEIGSSHFSDLTSLELVKDFSIK